MKNIFYTKIFSILILAFSAASASAQYSSTGMAGFINHTETACTAGGPRDCYPVVWPRTVAWPGAHQYPGPTLDQCNAAYASSCSGVGKLFYGPTLWGYASPTTSKKYMDVYCQNSSTHVTQLLGRCYLGVDTTVSVPIVTDQQDSY